MGFPHYSPRARPFHLIGNLSIDEKPKEKESEVVSTIETKRQFRAVTVFKAFCPQRYGQRWWINVDKISFVLFLSDVYEH